MTVKIEKENPKYQAILSALNDLGIGVGYCNIDYRPGNVEKFKLTATFKKMPEASKDIGHRI